VARDLDRDLSRSDGITRRSRLLELGHSRRVLGAAARSGRLAVPRRGWVNTGSAPEEAVRAVHLGGRLGGASALGSYGIWADAHDLVIATRPTSSRLPELRSGEVRIWLAERFPERSDRPWRVSVRDALLQHASLVERDSLIASFDSALYTRRLLPSQLSGVLAELPERLRGIRKELDGRAMSGTESKLRVALVRAGLRVDIQVTIGRVGIVDLLIDGWLIIEVDSTKYHGETVQQHRDRVRDGNSVLGRWGYLRFDYALVQFDLAWCVDVVLARHRAGRP
jgi:very-short-patch-repair endonuclease